MGDSARSIVYFAFAFLKFTTQLLREAGIVQHGASAAPPPRITGIGYDESTGVEESY